MAGRPRAAHTLYIYIQQAGFEQLSLQLGKHLEQARYLCLLPTYCLPTTCVLPTYYLLTYLLGKHLGQASYRVCALQGTMHASLDAATERLLSASRAEAEQEVFIHVHRRVRLTPSRRALAPCSSAPPRTPPRYPPWPRARQARRVPELEESVRQLEASLSATEDELHAVRAAPQEA